MLKGIYLGYKVNKTTEGAKMNDYMVVKVGKRTKQGIKFFESLTEALEDAENKSRKNKAEYNVLKRYDKCYMAYANFINGKRTK